MIVLSALSFMSNQTGKGVLHMDFLINLVMSVMGSVVGNFITKWLDRHGSDN